MLDCLLQNEGRGIVGFVKKIMFSMMIIFSLMLI